MGEEPDNKAQPSSTNLNKKTVKEAVEELPFGKVILHNLIDEGKGLRKGAVGTLVISIIVGWLAYEHGTHSTDENINTLNSTIGNLTSIIQSNSVSVQNLNQQLRYKDVENQKLTTERNQAITDAGIAKNSAVSW